MVRPWIFGGGLLADYSPDGRAIGVEILSPASTSVPVINGALARLNEAPLSTDEARPLAA